MAAWVSIEKISSNSGKAVIVMTKMSEHERIKAQILTQIPFSGIFPIVDRASLLEKLEAEEHAKLHVDDEEMTIEDACNLCDEKCYPLTCGDDLAKAIAEGYEKKKKTMGE